MTLTLIGIGLATENDISVKGLKAVKEADEVYLESYTNVLQCSQDELEAFYGRSVELAGRDLVEKQAEEKLLGPAKIKNICLLVIGDVFSATTHVDLYLRAKDAGVDVQVIHNASILSAIGVTGLSVYKFGKVTSIPFEHDQVRTPYQYLEQNKSIGAHTLFLLDLRPGEGKFLSIIEAIEYLHSQETLHNKGLVKSTQRFVACTRIGSPDQMIAYGTMEALSTVDFGSPPYCVIVPGDLHFVEEEAIARYRV